MSDLIFLINRKQILKDQQLEVETFLPLDYLQAKPLKQRLRDIREPKQVKLVYDVLKFDPPEIEKAVLFATNNALVCETPEDAMKVAYEIDRSRYDVRPQSQLFYFIFKKSVSVFGLNLLISL